MTDIDSESGAPLRATQDRAPERGGVADQAQAAREKLGQATGAVRQEAAHFADAAREKAVDQVETHKVAVTDALTIFADAIRKAGEELGQKDHTTAAHLVSQAADGLEGLSRSVAQKRPEEMLRAAREFGRANPTAFMAGAVLAGLALGRFARSSAQDEAASSTGPAHDEPIAAYSGVAGKGI